METNRGRQIRWVAAGAMVGMCIVGSATLLWPHRDKHNNTGLLSQGKGGLEAEGAGVAANLRASILGQQGNGVQGRGRQEMQARPTALAAVKSIINGELLSSGEKEAFLEDAKQAVQLEHWHEEWDRHRLSHILKRIAERAESKGAELEKQREARRRSHLHEEALARRKQIFRSEKHGFEQRAEEQDAQEEASANNASLPTSVEGPPSPVESIRNAHGGMRHAVEDERNFGPGAGYVEESVRGPQGEGKADRENEYLMEHRKREASWRERQEAIQKARGTYDNARKAVVAVKDELRNALAQRDQVTEVMRSDDMLTPDEAAEQLKPVKDKVQKLLEHAIDAKKEWDHAEKALQLAENDSTRPRLSFPPTDYHSPSEGGATDASKEAAKSRLAEKMSQA